MTGSDRLRTDHRIDPWLSVAHMVRRYAVLIVLAWVAVAVLVNVAVPPLEQVTKEHAVSLSIENAPSLKAMVRMGEAFKESRTYTMATVILEGDEPLGDSAHRYYDELVSAFRDDPVHIQNVQELWTDPLTAAAVQSADGKAVILQLNLSGNQGELLGVESVEAARAIVARTPVPPGVKAYVTGPAALVADTNHSGEQTVPKVTAAAVIVISVMLFLVYRSVITTIFLLSMVGIELAVARGGVAALGNTGAIGLSTFVISILVALVMASGSDYGIFLVGRYHEARQAGEDPETAYLTAYRGVAHVILASGLTIAGAAYCLSFTQLPAFQTMSAPCAVGILLAVAAALTLVPAALVIASRFGLLEPTRQVSARGWRRMGAAVVRWPAPIFAATCAVTLIGLLALPGFHISYKDRLYLPAGTPGQVGLAAAERHFPETRLTPEVLMVETDHDLRNSADFLVLNKLAKDLFHVTGVALVQGVTQPEGTPLPHTSIPSLLSIQAASQLQNITFVENRAEDLRKQADALSPTIAALQRMANLVDKLSDDAGQLTGGAREMTESIRDVRNSIADVEDTGRPFREAVYAESHCYSIPVCSASKSAYEAVDGLDKITGTLDELSPSLDNVDAVMPQLRALLGPPLAVLKSSQAVLLTVYSTVSGIIGQLSDLGSDVSAMGQDFDTAKNDDSFYLPHAVFDNPDFQRIMRLFVSPDGHAARFIITHQGDPTTPEGIARVDALYKAAAKSLKGTPLANSGIYVNGTAAVYKDVHDVSKYDLLIAASTSFCLIFIIMLLITRSLVAAAVIVTTVVASLAASFGISILLWQHIIGIDLYWVVPVFATITLLAVGSDYNLLLVARFRDEMGAGLNTGIIRAMGGTGKTVTAAGLVFAFTTISLLVSDLVVIGQIGTTIGLGLLFDTLVVRGFMTPAVAAMLGRWFWWPVNVENVRPHSPGVRSVPT